MIDGERKAMSLAAIVAALFVAAALGSVSGDASALQHSATTNEEPDLMDIRIADGKLSGEFNHRPLFEVLDAIGSQAGFAYQGYKDTLSRPVSGTFSEMPLVEAVERILEPFNHIIVFRANGEIERLRIVSLRSAPARSIPAGARVPPQTSSLNLAFGFEPAPSVNLDPATEERLLDLTIEERLAFEVADDKLGPPPQWLEYFEPRSEPGSEETGPPIPPEMAVQDLPQFEPVESETGPVDPSIVVQELPGFEPYVSETGPSLDTPENN